MDTQNFLWVTKSSRRPFQILSDSKPVHGLPNPHVSSQTIPAPPPNTQPANLHVAPKKASLQVSHPGTREPPTTAKTCPTRQGSAGLR